MSNVYVHFSQISFPARYSVVNFQLESHSLRFREVIILSSAHIRLPPSIRPPQIFFFDPQHRLPVCREGRHIQRKLPDKYTVPPHKPRIFLLYLSPPAFHREAHPLKIPPRKQAAPSRRTKSPFLPVCRHESSRGTRPPHSPGTAFHPLHIPRPGNAPDTEDSHPTGKMPPHRLRLPFLRRRYTEAFPPGQGSWPFPYKTSR